MEKLELLTNLSRSEELGEIIWLRENGTERIALLNVFPLKTGEVVGIAHFYRRSCHIG